MATVIPPAYAQVAFLHEHAPDPEPMICTMGFDLTGVGGAFEDAVEAILNAWQLQVVPNMDTNTLSIGCVAQIGQDGGPPLRIEVVTPTAGAIAGEYLPQNCALLVRKLTTLGGREGRGRMYVPYILLESDVSEVGAVATTRLADLQTTFSNLHADWMNTIGASAPATPPVLLHSEPQLGLTPVPTPITAFAVDGRIATQRRRLRR